MTDSLHRARAREASENRLAKEQLKAQRIELLHRLLRDPSTTRLEIRVRLAVPNKILSELAREAGVKLPDVGGAWRNL